MKKNWKNTNPPPATMVNLYPPFGTNGKALSGGRAS